MNGGTNMSGKLKKNVVLVTFFALLTLSSCVTIKFNKSYVQNTSIHKVNNYAKLESLLKKEKSNFKENILDSGMIGPPNTSGPQTETGENGREYVSTNLQDRNVDEADIIKTDGDEIYFAPRYDNRFYVLTVNDNFEVDVKHNIEVANFDIKGMYLLEDYVVVIGDKYIYSYESNVDYIDLTWHSYTKSTIKVYERVSLGLVYELTTNTAFIEHRLIDRSLFIVAHKKIYFDNAENRPWFKENEEEQAFISYSDLYYFDQTRLYAMTTIVGIKLDEDASKISFTDATYLGAGDTFFNVYANKNNLYFADSYTYHNKNESFNTLKVSQFAFNLEEATATYIASTILRGSALNQFSMDEYNGNLRIATTESHATWKRTYDGVKTYDTFENKISNLLYILRANPSTHSFTLVGGIFENLGKPNESIQSVRFDGDKAYIVTFLRTDPLYVINLSDAANPVITDAIELPGYDVYQHPWGENKLLGFGYTATIEGVTNGIKLTAYDTTEGGASELLTYKIPFAQEKDGYVWNNRYTEAIYNHKAILVSPEKGIFGFPLSASRSKYENNKYHFDYHSGYYIFKIDFDGTPIISEPLVIEHHSSPEYQDTIDRAVMIEDYLFTFSAARVVVYDFTNNAIHFSKDLI